MTSRRVAIGGLPYFGRMLAELLSGDGWDCRYNTSPSRSPEDWLATAAAIARADLVYLIGGQIQRWSRPDWLLRAYKGPVVMHWVGTDVSYAVAAKQSGTASAELLRRPIHWSEVDWTAEELAGVGIRSEIVPLTSTCLPLVPPPLPERFVVLAYLPDSRPEFYGRAGVLGLARSFPEVPFLVVGTDGPDCEGLGNLEFLGWQSDMTSVYARSTALLRLTKHDGLSFMVLEALASGRYVIWNRPFDGVLTALHDGDAKGRLEDLLSLHRRGELQLNHAGIRLVDSEYAPERIRMQILGRFAEILASSRPVY